MNIHVTNNNEFNRALNEATCGDIIYMAPGIYLMGETTGKLRWRFRMKLFLKRIHRWILGNSLEP